MASEVPSPTPAPATRLQAPIGLADGRYLLTDVLGQGGSAIVFRAYDRSLAQWRAVKVLQDPYAQRERARARFEAEARMMAALEHPNIVRLYDVQVEKRPYLVMELLPAGSLHHWLERNGPMPPRLAVECVRQVCNGLAFAHEWDVVHRDIKPHNILVDPGGSCRIADFGIGRLSVASGGSTRTGTVLGTLGFMAPEQRSSSRSVGTQADIYSTGATLWSLLRYEAPVDLFMADTEPELLDNIPEALHAVIIRATRHRAEERYQSANELADALLTAMPDLPVLSEDAPPLVQFVHTNLEIPDVARMSDLRSLSTFNIESDSAVPSGSTILPVAGSAETEHLELMTQLVESPTGGDSETESLANAIRNNEFPAYFLSLPRDPAIHVRAVLALVQRTPPGGRGPSSRLVVENRERIEGELARWTARNDSRGRTLMLAGASTLVCAVGIVSTLQFAPALGSAVPSMPGVSPIVVVEAAEQPDEPKPSDVVEPDDRSDPSLPTSADIPPPTAEFDRSPPPEQQPAPSLEADPSTTEDPDDVEIAAVDVGEPASPDDASDEAEQVPELEPIEDDAVVAVEDDLPPVPPDADRSPAPPASESKPAGTADAADLSWGVYTFAQDTPVDATILRRIFTGKMAFWPSGERVVVILPPAGSEAMEWVSQTTGMPEASLRRAIRQRAFQGAIAQPIDANSASYAARALKSIPGSVTVLQGQDAPNDAHQLSR